MLGLIITVIWGIIALIAMPVTAELALYKKIQTAEFVRDWHSPGIVQN